MGALGLAAMVLLVPAARPPHKLGLRQAPAADRLRWIETAVADLTKITGQNRLREAA